VGAVWQDTRVFLPDPLPGARYREALTDRWLRVEISGNGEPAAFSLADVFAALPVALIQETT
jgi:maltooligosyltrehalose synthase